ncbi:energy-coupling factor transporter transmembrane protein EcfT [Mycoplasmatota bacterium]|nr:energy-coupling factor transporter transmembrane protein EcfT [Mycoplasmatota bacterium]
MKCFEGYHPILLFIYFLGVIFITMFTMNPVLITISFVSSILFCGMLIGIKELVKSLLYSLPILIIIALTNPLFVHKGETILFFLNDNPVTLEAILYGLFAAMMIMSIFYWFKCYNEVMTSDKFIYLFGRIAPKLSLLLSMVLSFIPKFKKQFIAINDSQKALGIYASKSYVDKIRSKMRVLSILITWSLENSVETADSMRARGYGLKGRTSYSIFIWTSKDSILAIIIGMLTILVYGLMFADFGDYLLYPTMSTINISCLAIVLYIGLFLLMILTTILEIKENILWLYLKSKI